ncbi:hypothetical protein BU24DRAFT_464616 [Aaosphaeria arxii CBS 175.79]|uniref:F-box domain-containing protein n=1 Tax=Aaosphaeria arxii CBS 175.79 TaxID=1450172 RepID=A0A6A5XMB9_9PLEO|nr:uncharacterized protein BU24DRAFT_464616 [Aaosphaeria arxii CBS 175.79]KAF2013890.1 hypothetical protein BU24DRAFT_464616 [Aaosphaeria arxii CBS 175.79]
MASTLTDLMSNRFVRIQNAVLSYLKAPEILRLRLVSKHFRNIHRTAWTESEYNRMLQIFFSDPVGFRVLQEKYGFLLTGTPILGYLQRASIHTLENSDMPITIILDEECHDYVKEHLRNFLIQDGYEDVSNPASLSVSLFHSRSENRKHRAPRVYVREVDFGEGAWIQWRTGYSPILSTADMILATSTRIISVFPTSTFGQLQDYAMNKRKVAKKIRDRNQMGIRSNYQFLPDVRDLDEQDKTYTPSEEFADKRSIGDRYSWILLFDSDDVMTRYLTRYKSYSYQPLPSPSELEEGFGNDEDLLKASFLWPKCVKAMLRNRRRQRASESSLVLGIFDRISSVGRIWSG